MSDPVESYFSELRDIHNSGAGVAEASYYGPLASLLTAVGSKLKPKVTAIINLRNTGAGIPDGGLFTANQLKNSAPGVDPLLGQLPARGAIEVKGTSDDAFAVAGSEQVARYVDRYGLVLVTNLRDFALVGRNPDGIGMRTLETCSLATSEAAFWGMAQQPRKYALSAGEGLTEFLRRVLLHNAPLSDPKDLAWFLASYARTARLRLEQRHELPALDALRSQLEESLGLKFEGERGDHFFRSTLVQTLFYGMFASWVLWARDMDHAEAIPWDRRFQWETATATLHVPMVYELFRQFADVRQLGALGISEVLEWAEEILWRVDRKAFFEKFREEHAVQYFYEPFLEAFDPQLRKELGVWYTPDEVVKYMVARVDWALREELGIADGLADPSVVVLDPCCGTGAYLVEVLRKIDETLQAKGADALTRQDVKRAAMERVIGFEIMPAPFVVAHLQLGILLAELGVPLRDADERAAIYLTNALTGWNRDVAPPKERRGVAGQMHSTLLFPEFAEERDAADRIKREEQILVVIGNPPYNGFAGMAVDEERDLSDAYRTTKLAPKPQGQGLNDLYVRFFRLAERQIAERSGRGTVCLISNYSWLDGLSFPGMRERFLESFDSIWVDNLHGDRIVSEYAPDGRTSETVFAQGGKSPGIKVGTAISLLVRSASGGATQRVMYRDFDAAKAADRRRALVTAGTTTETYVTIAPVAAIGFPFKPKLMGAAYLKWALLAEIFQCGYPGVITARDDFLVDIDEGSLHERVDSYFDETVSDQEMMVICPQVMRSTNAFDAPRARRQLQSEGQRSGCFLRYYYRPFDLRWIYWSPSSTKLVERGRPEYVAGLGDSYMLGAAQRLRKAFDPPFVTKRLAAFHLIERGAVFFPPIVPTGGRQMALVSDGETELGSNLSVRAHEYLTESGSSCTSADLVMHATAILHAPRFALENAGGLMQDWPRIPLPSGAVELSHSVKLGRAVSNLLDVESAVSGVSSSQIRAELAPLAVLSCLGGGGLDPATDLAVLARWGMAGRDGITMPSVGKLVERSYTADERSAITQNFEGGDMSTDQTISLLGETCFDVYLNDVAYWRCVPANVWRYTIGGYQVIKKWLSYRERALLGRDLKPEEARYVTEMVRRITALVLMQPELDANYERVKADVWEWGK